MALDYTLIFEANISPDALLAKVAHITRLPKVRKNVLVDEISNFSVSVHSESESDQCSIEYHIEEYGFSPSCYLSIQLGKGEIKHKRSAEIMIEMVVALLQAYQGTIFLEFIDSDRPILQRKNDEILVNSEWIYYAGENRLSEAGLSQTVIDV